MNTGFPKDFLWGASSSAFQVEGAWDKDNKGKTVADYNSFKKSHLQADTKVASDFYNNYEEDIELMKELGMKTYRFSISWARIISDGEGEINQKGIDFYNNLIRRYTRFNPKNEESQQLSFKGLLIDLDQHTVTTNGETMLLPPKEFGVLLYCARHQGKILTKQQIYEAVWGEPYVYDDSNIMAIISRLRKKIELDPSSPIYLQTIKGIGYQFNTEV